MTALERREASGAHLCSRYYSSPAFCRVDLNMKSPFILASVALCDVPGFSKEMTKPVAFPPS